jgi:hypothetical protein
MSFCKAIKGVIIAACFSLYGGTGFAGGHGEANAFGFTLVVPAEEVDRVERLLASHKEFMNNTHSVTGDDEARLNSYSVIKAPEMVQFGDPSKGMTGKMIYILSEHYETPTGLAKHLAAGSKWTDIGEMQELIYKYGVAVVMGEKVSSMNR